MVRTTNTIRVKVVSISEAEITVETFSADHLNKIGKAPFVIGSVPVKHSGNVKLDGANHRPEIVFKAYRIEDASRLIERHTYDMVYHEV